MIDLEGELQLESLLMRGAWIEIWSMLVIPNKPAGRPLSRGRGLKFTHSSDGKRLTRVAPLAGAWIETRDASCIDLQT